MNNTKILFAIILGMLLCSCSEDFNFEKREGMKDIVEKEAIDNGVDLSEVYIIVSQQMIPPHTYINQDLYSPEETTWAYMVGKGPFSSVTYNYLYVFITENKNVIVKKSRWQPEFNKNKFEYVREFKETKAVDLDFEESNLLTTNIAPNIDTSNFYALIINGGQNPSMNYRCFWKDCSNMYKLLVNNYGYHKENIKLLISDGADPAQDMLIYMDPYSNYLYNSSPLDLVQTK